MTVVYLGLAWFGGIWLASHAQRLPDSAWAAYCLLFLACGLAVRRLGKSTPALLLFCGAAMAAGAWRYQLAQPQVDAHHIASYSDAGEVTLTGEVVAEPRVSESFIELLVATDTVTTSDGVTNSVAGLVQIRGPRFPLIPYGARIQAAGDLQGLPELEEANYRAYLARRGVLSVLSWPALEVTGQGGNPLRRLILAGKERAHETVNGILPEPQAALLAGILLGNDDGMSQALADDFQATGMTHIIAISGFNIAVLVGIVVWLGEPLIGRRGVLWLTLPAVVFYTILVGAEASVVRAAIMGLMLIISLRFLGWHTFALAPLVIAGVLMSIADPRVLWDIGFQLSFAATLGILLYVRPVSRWMSERLSPRIGMDLTRRTMRPLSELVIVTLAAQLLVLPILIYHFEELSLINPLANFLILPAQPGVMIIGGLATLVGMVSLPLGEALGWVAWLFLAYTISLVRLLADFPGAALPIRLQPTGLIAYYVVVLGVTWLAQQTAERRSALVAGLQQRTRPLLAAGAMAAVLVTLWVLSQPDGNLRVVFLDVGQGDATFIQTPSGRQLLIDGGPQPVLMSEQLGEQIPFWDRELDLVVATHPDNDHVAGLPGVLERYRVDMLLTNGELVDVTPAYRVLLHEADARGTTLHEAKAGESFDLGDGVILEVLHPGAERHGDNRNENSVSLRLSYGDFGLLLTGDAADWAEQAMVESGLPLNALVFKAGHHGSNTSSNDFFLEAVRPQIVVISAGADNRFGHPHAAVLERVAAVGAQVLRTDELGTIEVVTDGRQMWWRTDR